MAKVSQDKAMKEMVIKVKELYKDADDDSIQILLQHFDSNIEQTVQAFLDGSAEETLREWKSLGSGAKTSAAKKKKKNKNKNAAQNHNDVTSSAQSIPGIPAAPSESAALYNGGFNLDAKFLNGTHSPESEVTTVGVRSKQQSRAPVLDQKNPVQSRPKEDYKQQTKKARDRTLSEASTSSGVDRPSKTPHAGLEKSVKDLQRQTVSLQRLKVVLNEQVDKSFKRISEVFKELHNQLNEREAQLIFDLDKVKAQANNVLEDQQRTASELKLLTDRAQAMKESEVGELRIRIKTFVSDRKHYEDLSHAQRFICDFNHILEELKKFGEVVPVKASTDPRRVSVVSLGSSISHEEVMSPNKLPVSTTPAFTAQTSLSSQPLPVTVATSATAPVAAPTVVATPAVVTPAAATAPVSKPAVAAAATPRATAAAPPPFIPQSSHVLMQSESLTKYEATEMAQRLATLKLNVSQESQPSPTFKSPRPDRGRGSRGGRGTRTSMSSADRVSKPSSDEQPRNTQSARGQGQSRGGRGQGRSSRPQGETRSKNDATAVDSQGSNKPGDASAQAPVSTETNEPSSPSQHSSTNRPASNRSPRNNPRRGGRHGGRPDDSGGKTSGSTSTQAEVNDKTQNHDNHDNSAGGDGKSVPQDKDASPTPANKAVSDHLTNGQVEALPQRGNRPNRRDRGDAKQEKEDLLEASVGAEPVLVNGE